MAMINEIFARGNHSLKDKIKRKKINRLKKLKKCSANMTPSVSTKDGQVRVTCTPKDRTRARKQKRVMRIRKSKISAFRKSIAKARDTKKFRK